MTHEDAVNSQAAEKYFSGELTPEEREQFEEHYFDCPVCAEEVRVSEAFAANARAVFAGEAGRRATHRPAEPHKIRGLLGWRRPVFALAWAAAAVLVIVNVVLMMRLHRLDAPQAYPAFFLRGAARGDDQVLQAPRTARFVGLSVDLPPGPAAPGYDCTLVDAAGKPRQPVHVPAPGQPGATLNVLVPVSGLNPGRYTLVVASGGAEIGRYPFVFQFQ
ncbi:MAG TPA: zf-HC2 domain-containing protein [Bryobacteraceae bacterium]|nr:zf-HC2 domain-containing protein [Bryobacteraceae bacterium]